MLLHTSEFVCLHFSMCACHPCAGAMLIVCIVPILTDDPRRESTSELVCCFAQPKRTARAGIGSRLARASFGHGVDRKRSRVSRGQGLSTRS